MGGAEQITATVRMRKADSHNCGVAEDEQATSMLYTATATACLIPAPPMVRTKSNWLLFHLAMNFCKEQAKK
jgi:hypothetical protein